MDPASMNSTIRVVLGEMRRRLTEADSIVKSTEVCADTGNVEKAVQITLDLEQLCYKAGRLLDSASLSPRLSRENS